MSRTHLNDLVQFLTAPCPCIFSKSEGRIGADSPGTVTWPVLVSKTPEPKPHQTVIYKLRSKIRSRLGYLKMDVLNPLAIFPIIGWLRATTKHLQACSHWIVHQILNAYASSVLILIMTLPVQTHLWHLLRDICLIRIYACAEAFFIWQCTPLLQTLYSCRWKKTTTGWKCSECKSFTLTINLISILGCSTNLAWFRESR